MTTPATPGAQPSAPGSSPSASTPSALPSTPGPQPSASKTQRVTASPTAETGGPADSTRAPTAPPAGKRDAILADLAGRGISPGSITAWNALSVTWNDGSLGCPAPGHAYTQALIPGMQVLVTAAGRTFDYRFGRDDTPVLCTNKWAGSATPANQ